VAIDPQLPTTIYAPTAAGAFKTTDGGWSWTPINAGLTDVLTAYGVLADVFALAIDPVAPATLYAATRVGVFKSFDRGGSWSRSGLFQQSPLASIALEPASVIGGGSSTGTVRLRKTGQGNYSGQFTWLVNPQSISVRSNFCGSVSSRIVTK
jgi:hypothetical protein